MATAFQADAFANDAFQIDVAAAGPPLGGKGDNKRRKTIGLPIKPTGLVHRPILEGRKEVDERVSDAAQIAAEVAAKVAREFDAELDDVVELLPIEEMAFADIEAEIRARLRKKLRDEDEEIIALLILLATIS